MLPGFFIVWPYPSKKALLSSCQSDWHIFFFSFLLCPVLSPSQTKQCVSNMKKVALAPLFPIWYCFIFLNWKVCQCKWPTSGCMFFPQNLSLLILLEVGRVKEKFKCRCITATYRNPYIYWEMCSCTKHSTKPVNGQNIFASLCLF